MHTLLIHGGAHGAWCWREVQMAMSEAGHHSTAFDLPGSGADRTPRADIALSDYTERVVAQLDSCPPEPIRLVGHSIAGFVIPTVVAARPERVAEVVLVAAAVVPPGSRGIDTIPADRRASYFTAAAGTPDGTLLPDFEAARTRFFSDLSLDRAREAYARLTPQPFGPYLATVTSDLLSWSGPVRYLAFADDRNFPSAATEVFAATAGATAHTVPGDHCGMLSRPRDLAAALTHA